MKVLALAITMLVSVNLFADSTVVNDDMGPLRLVRKTITFTLEDCLSHLTFHPGSSYYNYKCLIPLTDTVGSVNFKTGAVQSYIDLDDGTKCLSRVNLSSHSLSFGANRAPGQPLLTEAQGRECLTKLYNKRFQNNAGIQYMVMSTHSNIDPTPVVRQIENPSDDNGDNNPTPPVIVNPIPRPPITPRPPRPRRR